MAYLLVIIIPPVASTSSRIPCNIDLSLLAYAAPCTSAIKRHPVRTQDRIRTAGRSAGTSGGVQPCRPLPVPMHLQIGSTHDDVLTDFAEKENFIERTSSFDLHSTRPRTSPALRQDMLRTSSCKVRARPPAVAHSTHAGYEQQAPRLVVEIDFYT